mgnify:CR=1 FL=1
MTNPFISLEYFTQQFNQGLHKLLDHEKLGTFILVLANATQHKELFSQLQAKLLTQFKTLKANYKHALLQGNQLNEVEEDLLVFLKIAAIGFENIQLTQSRQVGNWQCQFNHLRSFRPRRLSSLHNQNEMCIPFDENAFHFNKPFMAKECFWQGELNGKQVDLFYNKYPFADCHGLFVPQRESNQPQLLTETMHQYMWQVTEQLSHTLPGVGFGYNSYGAYASVNHLHFQMFIEPKGLPVSASHWQHNGGTENYPLTVIKKTNVNEAWQSIVELHNLKQPYNVLYTANEIYIMPRKAQGSVDVPEWSSGFTWYELCGAMLMFNRDDYLGLREGEISGLLGDVGVVG